MMPECSKLLVAEIMGSSAKLVKRVQPSRPGSDQEAERSLARRRSNPALPYMERLIVFSRLTCPSVGPLLQGSSMPALIARRSEKSPKAKRFSGVFSAAEIQVPIVEASCSRKKQRNCFASRSNSRTSGQTSATAAKSMIRPVEEEAEESQRCLHAQGLPSVGLDRLRQPLGENALGTAGREAEEAARAQTQVHGDSMPG
jgi:hypothetical protein